jgi:tetratricopeptide (TPR) repeat protein
MLSIFLNEGHLARWRGNALALIGDHEAVQSLYTALDTADPTFIRASAGLRCDLAQAHMARGEYDQAQEHLRQARLIANRTGSVRQRRRIEQLTQQL